MCDEDFSLYISLFYCTCLIMSFTKSLSSDSAEVTLSGGAGDGGLESVHSDTVNAVFCSRLVWDVSGRQSLGNNVSPSANYSRRSRLHHNTKKQLTVISNLHDCCWSVCLLHTLTLRRSRKC